MSNGIVRRGDRLSIDYEGRKFEVMVIDPDGLGQGQPSVGLGFRMGEKYMGIPEATLRSWVIEGDFLRTLKAPSGKAFEVIEGDFLRTLKAPSGKAFEVIEILGSDGNLYRVIEIADWILLVADVLKSPGKLRKGTKVKLIDFLSWFATKGFYAEAYTAIKGSYTAKDARATTRWQNDRAGGIPTRNAYTDFLQEQGCKGFDFASWTNVIYLGLFGKTSKAMIAQWALVEGNAKIARNYVPEAEGLRAVAYCEDMVVRMFVGDLAAAHEQAIALAKQKFSINLIEAA